jgi:hypothetical protein
MYRMHRGANPPTYPEEPPADAEGALSLSLRLLDGSRVPRRFSADATVAHALAFARAECARIKARDVDDVTLVAQFPRVQLDDPAARIADCVPSGTALVVQRVEVPVAIMRAEVEARIEHDRKNV